MRTIAGRLVVSIDDGDSIELAAQHLASCVPGSNEGHRWVQFGNWMVVSSTLTNAAAATLKVYRTYEDKTPMWERHQRSVAIAEVPDAFREIFMTACSGGYPARFQGDQMD